MENTQNNHGVNNDHKDRQSDTTVHPNHPQQYEEFVNDSPNHAPSNERIPEYPSDSDEEEETADENDLDTYEIDPDYEDDEDEDSEDDPANGLVYDDNDLEYDDLDEEEEGEHEGRG